MATEHVFAWIAINDTGPVYRCTICKGSLNPHIDQLKGTEDNPFPYKTPPVWLNKLPGNKTCGEVIARTVMES